MTQCFVSPDGSLRYIPIPKNATTSFIAAMFDLSGTAEEIHRKKPDTVRWTRDGPYTFTVVRDPLARLASTWRNKVHAPHRPDTRLIREFGFTTGMSFAGFLSRVEERGVRGLDSHIRPQLDFLPSPPGVWCVSPIPLETVTADEWSRRGLPGKYFPKRRLNASSSDGWRALYTPDLAARAARLYDNDLEFWRSL